MNLCVVAFGCGRDAAMVRPFLRMARTCYPGAEILIANDAANPCDPLDAPVVASHWSTLGAVAAVPEAMVEATMIHRGADLYIKTDMDVAHLSAAWLEPFSTGLYRTIGLQAKDHPWGFWGMGYAMTRGMVYAVASCCQRRFPGIAEEDLAASLKTRLRDPNGVFLHPYDPLGQGIYATWNPAGCRDVALYRRRFHLVHCGDRSMPREDVAALMDQFAAFDIGRGA